MLYINNRDIQLLSATLSNDSATMKLLPLTENILKYNETNNKILPTALV